MGDPDIVPDMGGLSPALAGQDQGHPEGGGKSDARSLQLRLTASSPAAPIGAMLLSALAKELEMMGRSGALEEAREGAEKLRVEFHLAVKAGNR